MKQVIENTFLRVEKIRGSGYFVLDMEGNVDSAATRNASYLVKKKAYDNDMYLYPHTTKTGKIRYRSIVRPNSLPDIEVANVECMDNNVNTMNLPMTISDIFNLVQSADNIKPAELKLSDLKWKQLVRSVLRGKNIIMMGESGSGKTFAAKCVAKALGRPLFVFNLGATQDARATLIGNTQFDKAKGTFFSRSEFITAIQTPNAVILLDEFSRASYEASNILMTVLDQDQRYVRLDEAQGSPVVNVAVGVSFVATANVGAKYTGTSQMDHAIKDRFVPIEMDLLQGDAELELLQQRFPNVDYDILYAMADIAAHTRTEYVKDSGKITECISTRVNVEAAEMIEDGFTFPEIAEVMYYPRFSNDGGVQSERVYIKQLVQKYFKGNDKKLFQSQDMI